MTLRSSKARAFGVFGVAIAVLGSVAVGTGTIAQAEELPSSDTSTYLSQPMDVIAWDASVAKANGFKIVTDANGVQSSVPVTDTAKALVANSSPGFSTQGYDDVNGNCGHSWIELSRNFTSVTKIKTGYTVRLPTRSRIWDVNLYGTAGIVSVGFSSPISGPATWSGYTQRSYGSGGFGNVVPGSSVTLTDGAVCASGSPGTTF